MIFYLTRTLGSGRRERDPTNRGTLPVTSRVRAPAQPEPNVGQPGLSAPREVVFSGVKHLIFLLT